MKIIYLIPGLYRPAGMERVLALKANLLAGAGYEIIFVTTEQKGRPHAFGLDPTIRHYDLGIGYEDNNGGSFASKALLYPVKLLRHRLRLGRLLRRERADVVVSTFCNEASFLPSIKDGSRKVLEAHFSRCKRLQYARRGLWAVADRLRSRIDARTAARYDRFVVLTQEDAALWGDLPGLAVIPNPRTFAPARPSGLSRRQVIASGRYTHQKGFDRLVRAWRMIDTEGWTLRIAGDGDSSLLGDAALLGPDIVTGPSGDMEAEYLDSSIFALSSRYEGLPMVLLEAQACGLPSVCFACRCGPSDVLAGGRGGILVEEGDIGAFAKALETLMQDEDLRRRMGEAARLNSLDYEPDKIMSLWKDLFASL